MAAMAELAATTGGHVAVDINEPRPPADAEECAVCLEPMEFVAIGPCGHSSVCSKCALRIRVNNKRECCICRGPSPVVVVTRARAGGVTGPKKKPAAVHARLPALGGGYQGRVGAYWYHAASAAYFDDERQYEAACCSAAAAGHESGGVAQAAPRPPACCNGNVALAVFCLAVTAAVMLIMIFA